MGRPLRKLEQRFNGFSLVGLGYCGPRKEGGEQPARNDEVKAKENELLIIRNCGIIVMCWTSVNKNLQSLIHPVGFSC